MSTRPQPTYSPDAFPRLIIAAEDTDTSDDVRFAKARTLYALIDMVMRDGSLPMLPRAEREAATRFLFASAWFASDRCQRRAAPPEGAVVSVFGTPAARVTTSLSSASPTTRELLGRVAGLPVGNEPPSAVALSSLVAHDDQDVLAAFVARITMASMSEGLARLAAEDPDSWGWYEALVALWAEWHGGSLPHSAARFRAESWRAFRLLFDPSRATNGGDEHLLGGLVEETRRRIVSAPIAWLLGAPAVFSIVLPAMFISIADYVGFDQAPALFPRFFRGFLFLYAALPLLVVGSLLDRRPRAAMALGLALLVGIAAVPLADLTDFRWALAIDAIPLCVALYALQRQLEQRGVQRRAALVSLASDPPSRVLFVAAAAVVLVVQAGRVHTYDALFTRGARALHQLHDAHDAVGDHFTRAAARLDEQRAGIWRASFAGAGPPDTASASKGTSALWTHFVTADTVLRPLSRSDSIGVGTYVSAVDALDRLGGSAPVRANISALDAAEARELVAVNRDTVFARRMRERRVRELLVQQKAASAYNHGLVLVQRMWATEFNVVRERLAIALLGSLLVLGYFASRADDARARALARAATVFIALLVLPTTRVVRSQDIDPDAPFAAFALAPWNGVEYVKDPSPDPSHGPVDAAGDPKQKTPPASNPATPTPPIDEPYTVPAVPPGGRIATKTDTVREYVVREDVVARHLQDVSAAVGTLNTTALDIKTATDRLGTRP